jgi:hypothetical protein
MGKLSVDADELVGAALMLEMAAHAKALPVVATDLIQKIGAAHDAARVAADAIAIAARMESRAVPGRHSIVELLSMRLVALRQGLAETETLIVAAGDELAGPVKDYLLESVKRATDEMGATGRIVHELAAFHTKRATEEAAAEATEPEFGPNEILAMEAAADLTPAEEAEREDRIIAALDASLDPAVLERIEEMLDV